LKKQTQCRPSTGNPKLEILNPKQGGLPKCYRAKQTQFERHAHRPRVQSAEGGHTLQSDPNRFLGGLSDLGGKWKNKANFTLWA
jgi:hypothetical protein